eukprot:TRINITY_DN8036_c0_g1_i2.p1 TRINITY_DN8036_c0_g1~~TRINITY_DN8036_c0_g1_i2.p1  ORF type:complete len:1551 (-),score=329.92 TRINITY_DN8036_c0_g1_i2:193-4845(-)
MHGYKVTRHTAPVTTHAGGAAVGVAATGIPAPPTGNQQVAQPAVYLRNLSPDDGMGREARYEYGSVTASAAVSGAGTPRHPGDMRHPGAVSERMATSPPLVSRHCSWPAFVTTVQDGLPAGPPTATVVTAAPAVVSPSTQVRRRRSLEILAPPVVGQAANGHASLQRMRSATTFVSSQPPASSSTAGPLRRTMYLEGKLLDGESHRSTAACSTADSEDSTSAGLASQASYRGFGVRRPCDGAFTGVDGRCHSPEVGLTDERVRLRRMSASLKVNIEQADQALSGMTGSEVFVPGTPTPAVSSKAPISMPTSAACSRRPSPCNTAVASRRPSPPATPGYPSRRPSPPATPGYPVSGRWVAPPSTEVAHVVVAASPGVPLPGVCCAPGALSPVVGRSVRHVVTRASSGSWHPNQGAVGLMPTVEQDLARKTALVQLADGAVAREVAAPAPRLAQTLWATKPVLTAQKAARAAAVSAAAAVARQASSSPSLPAAALEAWRYDEGTPLSGHSLTMPTGTVSGQTAAAYAFNGSSSAASSTAGSLGSGPALNFQYRPPPTQLLSRYDSSRTHTDVDSGNVTRRIDSASSTERHFGKDSVASEKEVTVSFHNFRNHLEEHLEQPEREPQPRSPAKDEEEPHAEADPDAEERKVRDRLDHEMRTRRLEAATGLQRALGHFEAVMALGHSAFDYVAADGTEEPLSPVSPAPRRRSSSCWNTRYCKTCSAELALGAKYCSECGAKCSVDDEAMVTGRQEEGGRAQQAAAPKRLRRCNTTRAGYPVAASPPKLRHAATSPLSQRQGPSPGNATPGSSGTPAASGSAAAGSKTPSAQSHAGKVRGARSPSPQRPSAISTSTSVAGTRRNSVSGRATPAGSRRHSTMASGGGAATPALLSHGMASATSTRVPTPERLATAATPPPQPEVVALSAAATTPPLSLPEAVYDLDATAPQVVRAGSGRQAATDLRGALKGLKALGGDEHRETATGRLVTQAEAALRELETREEAARDDLRQVLAREDSRSIDQLKEFKRRLSASIRVAKGFGLPACDLREAEVRRRRVHNHIEDLKGQIRVYCRIRPLNQRELDLGDVEAVRIVDNMTVEVPHMGKFAFDGVFAPGAQDEVFQDCRDLVQSAVDGHNVTIFAYGQTGAGKTYTMYGHPEQEGIAARAVGELFENVNGLRSRHDVSVNGSMVELYNNSVMDLLRPGGRRRSSGQGLDLFQKPEFLGIPREQTGGSSSSRSIPLSPTASARGGASGGDLTEHNAADAAELLDLLHWGLGNRTIAPNAMNPESSRSHVIFTMRVETTNRETGECVSGKILLCDLGGSERLKKSESMGHARKEAIEVNKSLTALGDVIAAIAKKQKQVPYRNHKITQILQDSLGGSAKTLMFVNCSPALSNVHETLMSLQYATRVKKITNAGVRSCSRAGSRPGSPSPFGLRRGSTDGGVLSPARTPPYLRTPASYCPTPHLGLGMTGSSAQSPISSPKRAHSPIGSPKMCLTPSMTPKAASATRELAPRDSGSSSRSGTRDLSFFPNATLTLAPAAAPKEVQLDDDASP